MSGGCGVKHPHAPKRAKRSVVSVARLSYKNLNRYQVEAIPSGHLISHSYTKVVIFFYMILIIEEQFWRFIEMLAFTFPTLCVFNQPAGVFLSFQKEIQGKRLKNRKTEKVNETSVSRCLRYQLQYMLLIPEY